MNPFSKYLRQWSSDAAFAAFVEHWDRLEHITIATYRGKLAVADAAPEFSRVWSWLRDHYPQVQEDLRPHWQATRAAGTPTEIDPFRLLLDIPEPQAIVGDWHAMQHLPAAREAINRYLVAEGRS